MLINLSADEEVLDNLVKDDAFVETLISKLTVSALLRNMISSKRKRGR